MKKKELLARLRYYQNWRKGADTPQPHPREVTQIIDSAITVIERANTKQVDISLYRRHVIDRIEITKGAMILDGYEPEDSCIKFLNELIKEI